MPAAQPGAANTADGVDFVDEQDTRRGVLGSLEHIADPAGADAHEHLDELRTVDGEERHARLASHRLGEQRLASTRRAHQERALGDARPESLKLRRVLQELDQLLQVVFHAFQAGDVLEGGALLAFFIAPCGALGESRENAAPHDLIARFAEQKPEAADEQDRERDRKQHERRVVVRRRHIPVRHALLVQLFLQHLERRDVRRDLEDFRQHGRRFADLGRFFRVRIRRGRLELAD